MTVKADTSVKWFHSAMADAPVLRGQSGALIELLDACLINGFSTRSPDSVVVAGGVATVSIGAGNPYEAHAVVRIAGAMPAELNGDWRVKAVTGTTFTFDCPGVMDGSATGTITAMMAPAGWGKPFSATNKAVYQSLLPDSTQLFLRIDDAAAQWTRVRGYEQMTDVDTGFGLFPTLAQVADNVFTWAKSNAASSAARAWVVAADGAAFYLFPFFSTSYLNMSAPYFFGDMVRLSPNDVYHCMIWAQATSAPSTPSASFGGLLLNTGSNSAVGTYVARRSSQEGGAGQIFKGGSSLSPRFGSDQPAYPSAVDGALHLHSPIVIVDGTSVTGSSATDPIRGLLPGVAQPLQLLPLSHLSQFDGVGIHAGRRMMMVSVDGGGTYYGRVAIDITGAWR